MPLLPLQIGNGSNLDVDATTVKDGALVSLINAYEDRGGAIKTWPGHTLYSAVDSTVADDRRVWTHYSSLRSVMVIVCNGRIYKQTAPNAALIEITGATLDSSVVPSFTEDADNVFVSANSAIYKLDLTANTAGLLGAIVPTLEIALTAASVAETGRTIALACPGSTSIYYTIDGTPPDKTKTRYTTPVSITNAQTLRAIAYNDDDVESDIVSSDDFQVNFVVDGEYPNPRLVKLLADKAAAVYYTIDGTTPDTTKTAYDLPVSVATDLTLKAIAYDDNGSASEIITKEFTVDPAEAVKPSVKKFTTDGIDVDHVKIKELTATDKVGVTAYCITEGASGSTPPALNDPVWAAEIKTYYSRYPTAGARNIYPWARDAAGNISNVDTPISIDFPAAKLNPDPFTFTPQTEVKRSQWVESDAVQPGGFNFDTVMTISGGEYAVSSNGGYVWTNWRTGSYLFKRNDVVKVRHTSSPIGGTATTTTLTIGTTVATFTSTTEKDQLPRSVTRLAYIGGYVMAIGQPAVGNAVAGDVMFSDDKVNNYAAWEVYNNENNPDAVNSLIIAYEQVYNIGTKTTEVAIIDGTTPFAVNRNAFQHHGTMAPNSPAFDGESIYFLTEIAGSRKVVKLAGGSAPKIISMPIDVPLEQMGTISDAVGYCMGFRGQNFYCLDFPSANVSIDDQQWNGITLAYHLQKEAWVIIGRYDSENSVYGLYRGTSYTYVEPWGLSLVGGRDGNIYKLSENDTLDYTEEPVLVHRWRDDHSPQWQAGRTIALGPIGDYSYPPDEYQGGLYRSRQHELTYSDPILDAGEMFRAVAKTGWIDHSRPVGKIAAFYRYNVKRGKNELVINGISEQVNFLRR